MVIIFGMVYAVCHTREKNILSTKEGRQFDFRLFFLNVKEI